MLYYYQCIEEIDCDRWFYFGNVDLSFILKNKMKELSQLEDGETPCLMTFLKMR